MYPCSAFEGLTLAAKLIESPKMIFVGTEPTSHQSHDSLYVTVKNSMLEGSGCGTTKVKLNDAPWDEVTESSYVPGSLAVKLNVPE